MNETRTYLLFWITDYAKDHEINLSLIETVKIVEAISDYSSNGLTEELEDKIKTIDKWIRTKKKNPSTGSLTLKK